MNAPSVKKLKKLTFSPELKMILTECLTFAVGFFLMQIKFAFGTYPFGIAFVAACGFATPFAFAGALLSAIFVMGVNIPYIIALIGLLAARIAGSIWLGGGKKAKVSLDDKKHSNIFEAFFSEKTEVRVSLATLTALGLGVYTVISNGYLYSDVFILLFFCIFEAIMTFCFSGVFVSGEAKDKNFILALSAFAFCAIYAISGREIGGIDISIILSYAIILYLSRYVSGEYSALVGVILGLTLDTPYAPVFAIAGIVAAFLWTSSPLLSILCAMIISMGYGIFTSGYAAIVYLLPEILAASMLMYPLIRFEILPKPDFIKREKAKGGKNIVAVSCEKEISNAKTKMLELSGSFKEIGKMLEEVSIKVKNPTRAHVFNLCLEECERYCSSCPKKQICWEKDTITTQENITKISEALFADGNVDYKVIEEKFHHRCPNIDTIFDNINTKKQYWYKENLQNDKLDVSSKDYEMISSILTSVSELLQEESKKDSPLSEKLLRASAKIGFVCDEIEVYGVRRKKIIATGVDISRSKCSIEELVGTYENIVGMKISDPVFENRDNYMVMTMEATRKFEAVAYTSSATTDKENINGDTISIFDGYGDRKYMLICDGMASGEEASFTSQMCASFLEKILCTVSEKHLCLSMLNNFIRSKSAECSSSIDLMEIDLLNGNSSFIKSGAAPSFIKRGDNVYKLHSKTAPIGIMKKLDAEELAFSLKKGDVCIMVSDGIVASEEESGWLVELLKNASEKNIPALPELIVKEAKEKSPRTDDMTVGVLVLE